MSNGTGSIENFRISTVMIEPDPSAIEQGEVAISFVVETANGLGYAARLSSCDFLRSKGGIRCIVGFLTLDGLGVGFGVYFTSSEGTSFCCFCAP